VRSGNVNLKQLATNKNLLIEGTSDWKFTAYVPKILKREHIITGIEILIHI